MKNKYLEHLEEEIKKCEELVEEYIKDLKNNFNSGKLKAVMGLKKKGREMSEEATFIRESLGF